MTSKQKRIGSKSLLREFFINNIGKVVNASELLDAAKGATNYARRIRELRQEEGWPIKTHNDRNDLSPGQYILESQPPEKSDYVFARAISKRLRAQVLERNGYTCQMCGLAAGDYYPERPDTRVQLQIGHVIDKQHGGKEELGNLKAYCSECNQGARDLVQEPPSHTWLLSQIRRAKVDDQKAILEWLRKKHKEH